jgi:hypothetical protein
VNQTEQLATFFSAQNWKPSLDRFPRSGYSLVDEINKLRPRIVVDIGCGFNLFKPKIPNLIGIDLANHNADLVCDMRDAPFKAGSVDVALALGSINFGSREKVTEELSIVHRWLVSGGLLYLRVNPGEPIADDIVIFPWSEELLEEIGTEVGFVIKDGIEEERLTLATGGAARRLFCVFRKV